ncbi:hypothetical protein KEM56_003679 [Ascosphaera pollenicola]|nr:hypothetical protein KEM56_003679 [Ascosphaera pollenicola]
MSFYPPGWDYDRVLNASSTSEFFSMTDEQHATLFAGLKEAGLYDGVIEVWRRRQEERKAAAEANQPEEERLRSRELSAPYLDNLNYVFRFTEWSEWGFVIYRACCYAPTQENRWAQFRARFDKILDDEAAEYHNYHPKLDRAIELRRNIWIEDPALENASPAEISRRYAQVWPTLLPGHAMAVCLMVTLDSVESVLNSPLPSSAPLKQRKSLPFVVAVDMQAHEMPFDLPSEELESADDASSWPSFRVAVESLMPNLYGTIDGINLPLLTSKISHEKDIWLDQFILDDDGVRHSEDTS